METACKTHKRCYLYVNQSEASRNNSNTCWNREGDDDNGACKHYYKNFVRMFYDLLILVKTFEV